MPLWAILIIGIVVVLHFSLNGWLTLGVMMAAIDLCKPISIWKLVLSFLFADLLIAWIFGLSFAIGYLERSPRFRPFAKIMERRFVRRPQDSP